MTNKETAYQKISELVQRFTEQFASYKSAEYNETLTRRDFIDPFFKALGWDIDNEQGYAESYREVIHEDKIKVGGATKAPDYSFRLGGGKRLFFVEAKKPSVDIKEGIQSAFQIRRYGWSAKLAISVITDFEEFSIYDCTKKPKKNDNAAVARIEYFTYKDYLNKFDFLWNTFSKEQVLKGSFDAFLKGTANKKGTTTVDKDFLQSLDQWRTYLATSISWNNKHLDEDEINFAVQQTIDRLIFLRIAEDRGIEIYGSLKGAIKQGDCYKNLYQLFEQADDKYNSGLFDFKKDKISANLAVDNKVLKTIVNELYYPESPYEFSVLSVEILGSAYEQFLGKTITIDKGHRAKIEEKPEVRKAGGVYYTPQYIVDYIVKNTVGTLLEGKTPAEVAEIKIVDPACGSGSFLIGAFQYLLDWHKDYYTKNGTLRQTQSSKAKDNRLTPEGNLTTGEKKRILLNNIYGVDIDVNAVEVTKLSLLLKCLEGETEASIKNQFSMFHERVLPTLENNIKDGNSLIDLDYYAGELDLGFEKKIKPFSWKRAFPEVFKIRKPDNKEELKWHNKQIIKQAEDAEEKAKELIRKFGGVTKEPLEDYGDSGGFDVVIGNPPYDVLEKDRLGEFIPHLALQQYIKTNHSYINALGGKLNLYRFFIIKTIQLTKNKGRFGLIVPSSLLGDKSCNSTRKYLLTNSNSLEFDCFPQKDNPFKRIFEEAKLSTTIFFAEKSRLIDERGNNFSIRTYPANSFEDTHKNCVIQFKDLKEIDPENIPIPLIDTSNWEVLKKIHTIKGIQNLGKIKDFVIRRGEINQTIYKEFIEDELKENEVLIKGVQIGQYRFNKKISQGKVEWFNEKKFQQKNSKREICTFERIATQRITGVDERLRLVANIIKPKAYFADSTNSIHLLEGAQYDLKYLLGLINSKLFQWRFKLTSTNNNVGTNEIEALPFKEIDFDKDQDANLHNEIVKLVDQLLKLNEEKQEAKLESKLNQLQAKIDYCEDRINEIVYELYGLTEEERKLIETAK